MTLKSISLSYFNLFYLLSGYLFINFEESPLLIPVFVLSVSWYLPFPRGGIKTASVTPALEQGTQLMRVRKFHTGKMVCHASTFNLIHQLFRACYLEPNTHI